MKPAILITGATKRIGRTMAEAFGTAGWHVVIHHRDSAEDAQALADSLPSAEIIACELGDSAACMAMVGHLAERLPDWRALINCAAMFDSDTAQALDPAVFSETMGVNAEAPVILAQCFLAQSTATGGRRVVNVLDQKLRNPNPDFFSYTMAKHALSSATRMLAMAQSKVRPADRIHGLAPGAMLPSFDQRNEEHEVSGRMNLLHRLTDPQELADAALFLCDGWLASGETLFVDSGQHLLAQPRDVLYLARGLT